MREEKRNGNEGKAGKRERNKEEINDGWRYGRWKRCTKRKEESRR
jgi:hypothetical protein